MDSFHIPSRSRRKKPYLRALLTSFLVIAILLGGLFFLFQRESFEENTGVGSVTLLIRPGESADAISEKLLAEDLISNKYLFWLYLKWSDQAGDLKAGKHVIPQGISLSSIVEILSKAESEQVSLTIPEGFTVAQIDSLLARQGILNAGEIIRCSQECDFGDFDFLDSKNQNLEGYLFPDTYYIDPTQTNAESFLRRVLQNFETKTADLRAEAKDASKDWAEVIIMASLIEKETRTDDERPMVSDILWRRLNIGMHLGVDATLRYSLNDWDTPLTYDELQDDSAFNTRKHLGLPPSPIANPGLNSIQAALHPKKNAYYYYLHDSEGGIHYGVSLEEHNRNKSLYIY